MIDRVRSFKYNNTIVDFSENSLITSIPSKTRKKKYETKSEKDALQTLKNKPATFFWMANDLMWLQDIILRGAPENIIVEGLKNTQTYIQNLGMKGTQTDIEISDIIENVENHIKSGFVKWDTNYRLSLIYKIDEIKTTLTSLFKKVEPKFKKYRIFLS